MEGKGGGMRIPVFVPVLLLAVMAAGCGDVTVEVEVSDSDAIRGSGNVVTESRTVSGFDEVVVLGFGTVEIDVSGSESLEIEAEDNLMQYLTTEVKGGRLELGTRDDVSLSPTEPVVYRISAAALNGVQILGSGDVSAAGIDTESFAVEVNGSGDVQPTGEAASLDVQINGSGDFAGSELISVTGTVSINGSGNVVVNVTDELEVRVAGSGDVEYLGNPVITQSVSGSGEIRPR